MRVFSISQAVKYVVKMAVPRKRCKVETQLLQTTNKKGKGKGFPYSILSVGPRTDPGVQAVSPQVTIPGGRLPLE